jgi:rSAM/selenodomain-associated transferase 1
MRRLLLFAKRPRLGRVKTRLVPPLLAEQALDLYRAFLLDQLRFLMSFAGNLDVELRLDGPWTADLGEIPAPPGLVVRQQGPGDLGMRLLRAFEESRADGARASVVIATDSPTLPARHVLRAFDELDRGADAIAAPADDGGYVLIGMCRPLPELFHGVPWSTSDVMDITAARARQGGIALRRIEPWYDVDDVAALRRLRLELSGVSVERAAATARCMASLAPF